jgi:hypothetical protein
MADTDAERIAATIDLMSAFEGRLEGRGWGNYPAIDAFEWEEALRFELDRTYPMFHYEQRTWIAPTGEASHWESGFIRPVGDGSVEISNSQDSGRVEVLRGKPVRIRDEIRLELECVVLDHDPRLVRTQRVFTLRGDTLRYTVSMSTTTTTEPRMQQHLIATLERVRADAS